MYDDDRLKELRRNFLQGNRPEELTQLAAEGELEAYLQRAADRCRREQKRLVESGETFEEQAWQWPV